jgi:hypothetical protein
MRLSKARAAVEAFESDRIESLLEHATERERLELLASSDAMVSVVVNAADQIK